MKKSGFFAFQIHKSEHDRILSELNQLTKDWEKQKNSERIVHYLKSRFVPWLLEHIQTMDTATAAYLRGVFPLKPSKGF
jgi:hemerythrin